jgi:hypothetical protein
MPKKRLTTEEFVLRANNIHGNRYDYSLVEYAGTCTKVKIICKTHGVFEQGAQNHFRGQNCPKCAGKQGGKKRLTTEHYISRSNVVHNNKYDYSLTKYINNSTRVEIICPAHGMFEQIPQNHFRGEGCPKCGRLNAKQTNLEKYEVENPQQSQLIRAKVRKTNLQKYGVEYGLMSSVVIDKRKKTNLQRYGVDNVFAAGIIQQKIRDTNIERYGVEHPSKNNDIKQKWKNTVIQRYGVEHPSQLDQVKEKKKQTSLKNYHVENPNQSDQVKQKKKQTSLVKYGVEHPNQRPIASSILGKLDTRGWLEQQHHVHKKTLAQISFELGVSESLAALYAQKHGISVKRYISCHQCIQWLENIMKDHGIFIQHANNLGEYRIPSTRLYVDGYCKETNTIYEFYGDYWHGNPKVYQPDYYNRVLDTTMGELYQRTLTRENIIIEHGYKLVMIWEKDFNLLLNSSFSKHLHNDTSAPNSV